MKTLEEHNKDPKYPDFDGDKTGIACDYCGAELRAFHPRHINLDIFGSMWLFCPKEHQECLDNDWHKPSASYCSGPRCEKDNPSNLLIGIKNTHFIDENGNKVFLTKHEQSFLLNTNKVGGNVK